MSSLITPRGSRHVYQMSMDNYPSFHVGAYRAERNVWLTLARAHTGVASHEHSRAGHIRYAKEAHRNFLRCLREYRRELAMREAA